MSFATDFLNRAGIPTEDKPGYFENWGDDLKNIWNSMGKSKIGGQLREWFGEQNPYSAEGQQRAENQRARDFSAEQAQLQREWEERMSSTSFERGMEDLQRSGLNPILAYSQGGASTPVGGVANGAGTAHTADSNPIGQMGRIAQMVIGGVTAGARIAQNNSLSMAKILAQEEMQDSRNATARDIATNRNDTLWGINNQRETNKNIQHMDKINYGYLSRHRREN